jgi:transposase
LVEAGESRREVARLLDLAASTTIRWMDRWQTTGNVAAKPGTGYCHSPLEQHEQWLLDLVAAEPDLTLDEIGTRLASAKKLTVGRTSVWRFYDRHRITFKKTLHAAEQDRPDVVAARAELKAEQSSLRAKRLVFIDETSVTTKMVRHSGRCPRGERLVASVPHGHWKTLTFIAALRVDGLTAPYVIDGAMDGVHIHGLCRAGARANADKRRHRVHGQSADPQNRRGTRWRRRGSVARCAGQAI